MSIKSQEFNQIFQSGDIDVTGAIKACARQGAIYANVRLSAEALRNKGCCVYAELWQLLTHSPFSVIRRRPHLSHRTLNFCDWDTGFFFTISLLPDRVFTSQLVTFDCKKLKVRWKNAQKEVKESHSRRPPPRMEQLLRYFCMSGLKDIGR